MSFQQTKQFIKNMGTFQEKLLMFPKKHRQFFSKHRVSKHMFHNLFIFLIIKNIL